MPHLHRLQFTPRRSRFPVFWLRLLLRFNDVESIQTLQIHFESPSSSTLFSPSSGDLFHSLDQTGKSEGRTGLFKTKEKSSLTAKMGGRLMKNHEIKRSGSDFFFYKYISR